MEKKIIIKNLKEDIEEMLLDHVCDENNFEARNEFKLKVDEICSKYVEEGKIFNFVNKCDLENNTQNLIDEKILIVNNFTEVIPSEGITANDFTIIKNK